MRRSLLLALLLLVLPAAARAATWQPVGDSIPSGATELAVRGTTPFVARIDADGDLTVVRRSGGQWVQVGSRLSHLDAFNPDFAVSGNRVWITWAELDGIHLARLSQGTFQEIGSGVLHGGGSFFGEPEVAIQDGRPYVSFLEFGSDFDTLRVVRPTADRKGFEHIDAGTDQVFGTPRLVTVAGRVHMVYSRDDQTVVLRLNAAATGWEHVTTQEEGFGVLDAVYGAGALHAVVSGDVRRLLPDGTLEFLPGADAPFEALGIVNGARYGAVRTTTSALQFRAFQGGAWQPFPSPPDQTAPIVRAQFARADGRLWLLWVEPGVSHVARLAP